ncbi:MAG: M12 family metallo-peptidase [Anaerolineales bacterium]|nr:M12 family metallo-peptidase [Anaerolineales bacterium]
MQRHWFFLLIFACILLALGLSGVDAGGDVLFTDQGPTLSATEPGIGQSKRVAVNWEALNNGRSPLLKINLFNGQEITAVRDRLDPSSAAGGYVWVGHVQGETQSAVTLSVVDDVLIGSIHSSANDPIDIRYQNGTQILQQVDNDKRILVEGPDTAEAGFYPQARDQAQLCEDGTRIDLLVAYTAQARQQEGGTAAIAALINQRVADMNTANNNSGLAFDYNLVHVMETGYAETGNVSVDLPRLRDPGDGHLDDVAAARNTHLADMVSLLIAESTVNNSCGVGYVMNSLSTNFAYSAMNIAALDYIGPQYYCSAQTLAHEFGHNMGNLHDRAHNSLTPLLPYAYGYQPDSANFRTIMSYNCPGGCPTINHWSDPDDSYNGEATGIDHNVNPSNSADNARSMAQTAYYIANFRQNCAAEPTNTPLPTATHTPTATATNSPTASATSLPTATHTPGPPPSATPTTAVSATPTMQISSTPTATRDLSFEPTHRSFVPLAFTR